MSTSAARLGRLPHRQIARVSLACSIYILCALLVPATLCSASTESGEPSPADLAAMSLDQLLRLEVTSVSRQPEQLSEAPAAVFVVTREDIQRSGYTTIPDLLRLVPGMAVAQLNSSLWAVSARGFSGRFSRDLLVLVDGRSVYTTSFSGVYWETQDLLLDDIERIEVIRGPGATLWGANAVNGVINIITRDPVDTQGGLAQVAAGSSEKGLAGLRYGMPLGNSAHLRMWGKGFARRGTETMDGSSLADSWNFLRGGFRMDWNRTSAQHVSVQGAVLDGTQGLHYGLASVDAPYYQDVQTRCALGGGHLLASWQQNFSSTSDVTVQAYFDRATRRDPVFGEERTTEDLDLQHRFAVQSRLGMIWGLGYRRTDLTLRGSDHIGVTTAGSGHGENLRSGFVQTDLSLAGERLQVIAGCKLEDTDQIDLEVQPSARILWHPGSSQTLWGAISRAVRTPSVGEQHTETWLATVPPMNPKNPSPLPVEIMLVGTEAFKDEVLMAREIGYRAQPAAEVFVDLTLFQMSYKGLRGMDAGTPVLAASPAPHLSLPVFLGNHTDGVTRGFELASEWTARPSLRLKTSYSFLKVIRSTTSSNLLGVGFPELSSTPRHQTSVRMSIDLSKNWDMDLIGRYVGEIAGLGIDAYGVADGRLAWRPRSGLELSLAARNLGTSKHSELNYEFDSAKASIPPSVTGAVSWNF